MRSVLSASAVAVVFAISGCAARSSSLAVAPTGTAWQGPILVTQAGIPAGIDYKVIGSVQADAQAGYDAAATLYPLLAEEARKMGANAVINAKGGRRVTAFSWSAGYVSGTAVKVDDIQLLKSVPGTYH